MITKTFAFFNAVALLVATAAAQPGGGRVLEVEPETDYRPLLRQLEPGDELVFLPGVHQGHAILQNSGTAEQPITIRGVIEEGERPELRFTGRGHNLWRIQASHLVVRDLAFHATHAYGIRVDRADDITIENCLFRDCGGGDLSANSGNVDGLRIRHCRFLGTRRTPVYIGNHQGRLDIRNFVFERNFMDGSQIEPAPNTVGYAIQLKLNVRGGVIRDNFITGALGPGIMVYGAEGARPEDASRIERNIVIGSQRNPGIIVGGGPAVVKNNLVLGCRSGGISIFNYNRRNLLEQIQVVDNVAVANRPYDFSFDRPLIGLTAQGNRAWSVGEAEGFRRLPDADTVSDNQTAVAEQSLLRLVEQLAEVSASHDILDPLWERLLDPPASAEELQRLLAPLLATQ